MPVLVVGADTSTGAAIMEALAGRDGEIRAFVSNATVGAELKESGAKVATGDVSDASHGGGAATSVFSAVLVAAAASDERERSFAHSPLEVARAWAEGLADAGVRRIIWVGDRELADAAELAACAPEYAVVESADALDAAKQVAELDERLSI